MSLKEQVYSVLVVSNAENFNHILTEMLPPSQYDPVHVSTNINDAKRRLASRGYDFIIVNSPLPDDPGIRFSIDCCRSHSTVVLILVKSDLYAGIHNKVAEYGVFTLPKPTSRTTLMQGLNWLSSARERLRQLEQKTYSIEERMEEIRIVNRAKCVLISEFHMTESEAHRYLEKNAMDHCITKRKAAEEIIKTYG